MTNATTDRQQQEPAPEKPPAPPPQRAAPSPELLQLQLRKQELALNDPARAAAAEQIGAFELSQREAAAMSQSSMLPPAFCEFRFDRDGNILLHPDRTPVRNPEALANCMIVIEYARRLRMAPLAVIQNVDIIHGRPGLRSTFLIGTVNTCGRFSPLRFKQVGTAGKDDYGYLAYATSKEDGELCEGVPITWEMVKAEGWHSKSGSKWKTMPEQMFRYRAATFWTRIYAPELAMGLRPADELEDIGPDARPALPGMGAGSPKALQAALTRDASQPVIDVQASPPDPRPASPPVANAPQTPPAPKSEPKDVALPKAAPAPDVAPAKTKTTGKALLVDPQTAPSDKAKLQEQAKAAGAKDQKPVPARDGSDGSVAPEDEPPGDGDEWPPGRA